MFLGATLFGSAEYVNLNTSNAAYITDLYEGYLHRAPEGAGFDFWLGVLNSGTSRADVRAGFALSTEFQNNVSSLCGTMGGLSSGIRYVLLDLQGSPRAVMNNDGFGSSSVIARHDYLPFGEEIWAGTGLRTLAQGYGAVSTHRLKYASTERDSTTGLDHTWWRKYESLSGRWTTPDPYRGSMAVVNPQSFNRYSYVQNDPVNFVDPTGLVMIRGFLACGLATIDFWNGEEWDSIVAEVCVIVIVISPSSGPDVVGGGPGLGQDRSKPAAKTCDATLTGDAEVDSFAQHLFGESTTGAIAEYTGMAQAFMNRANLNIGGFGCKNLSQVLAIGSNADNNGGNVPFKQAATNESIGAMNAEQCEAYKRAQAAVKNVLRGDAGGLSGAGVSDFRSDYLWFDSDSPQPRSIPQGGSRLTVGEWTFRNYDYRGRDKKGNAIYKFGADYLKDAQCK